MSFSAVIGNLRANLGLDTAQFDRGLDSAQSRLSNAQQSFARFAGAAAAVGTALGALGVRTITSAKEISRLSQVANAAPEQFQRWAAASQTLGVEQDKLADILKDVNDRVGDFLQTGGGEMADFFENIAPRVGVTAEQFAKLSGPEALQLYVSSLEKAGVNQQEMTYYLEAMASDLTLLQPLLRNGGEEMNRLADQAEGFGAIMDEKTIASLTRAKGALAQVQLVFKGFSNILGAAVAPMIERTANAFVSLSQEGAPLNDAVRTLAANLERLVSYAATAVAAFGVRFVGALAAARLATMTLSKALLVLRGSLIRTGFGALVVAAGELAYQFTKLVGAAGGFGAAFALVLEAGREAFQSIDTLGQALVDGMTATALTIAAAFLDGFDYIRAGFGKLVNWMLSSPILEALGVDIGQMAEGWVNGGDFGELSASLKDRAAGLFGSSANGFNEAIPSLQKIRDLMADTSDVTDAATNSAGALDTALGGIDGIGGDGTGGAKGAKEKISDFARAVQGTKEEVQRLKHEMESLVSAEASASGVADALTYARKRAELLSAAERSGMEITPQLTARVNELAGAYARAGQDAEDAADRLQAMEDQADRGADAITNMFSRMLDGSEGLKGALASILQQIAQFQLSEGVSGLFGQGGAFGNIGSMLGGLIGANANGTKNWRGGWTMVGERGRELVNLPRGSQVVRNSDTENMIGGGGGVNFAPQFTIGGDDREVAALRAKLSTLSQEFEGRVVQTVRAARTQRAL